MPSPPDEAFLRLRRQVAKSLNEGLAITRLEEVCTATADWLADKERIGLVSKVSGKEFFAFESGERLSRAVNNALFINDAAAIQKFFAAIRARSFEGFDELSLTASVTRSPSDFAASKIAQAREIRRHPGHSSSISPRS